MACVILLWMTVGMRYIAMDDSRCALYYYGWQLACVILPWITVGVRYITSGGVRYITMDDSRRALYCHG